MIIKLTAIFTSCLLFCYYEALLKYYMKMEAGLGKTPSEFYTNYN